MLISSATPAGPPPTVRFIAPADWTHVEIRLEDFPTPTPSRATYSAAGSTNRFCLWISLDRGQRRVTPFRSSRGIHRPRRFADAA